MGELTKAQRAALEWFASAPDGHNWSRGVSRIHPWTFGSLANRGLIEDWNHPQRDEVWSITEAGRAALEPRDER